MIEDAKITQDKLADALAVSRLTVNQLVNNKRAVTAEMALRLSRVLGTTPEFWLNLQRNVDLYDAWDEHHADINSLKPLLSAEIDADN